MKYIIIFSLLFILLFVSPTLSKDNDPHATGALRPTKKEKNNQRKTMYKTIGAKLNKLAISRINEERTKNGIEILYPNNIDLAEIGEEALTIEASSMSNILPSYVDNSKLKYFPPIRSQGSLGSCACFSTTYYQMTYMTAMIRDFDAKNGGDAFRFSPKWTYNMLNEGSASNGTYPYSSIRIMQQHGAATWEQFPYNSDARGWCMEPETWRDAIDYRINKIGCVINIDTPTGLETLKILLSDGYILNFCTYITSWSYRQIKDNPNSDLDDLFVGKYVCQYVIGKNGPHSMTVVGYNDDIWTDVNEDGSIDEGELGAFLIANSWGTSWADGGFVWFAYDALKEISDIPNVSSVGRTEGWWFDEAVWFTARAFYEPKLLAKFTLNSASRQEISINLGISDINKTQPQIWYFATMIQEQGGNYAFNGSTTPCDGTFYFDFTDLVPLDATKKYYIQIYDASPGNPTALKDVELINAINEEVELVYQGVPYVVDGEHGGIFENYYYPYGNQEPTAIIIAAPTSGPLPLSVEFDASQSYDIDGTINKYFWDGSQGYVYYYKTFNEFGFHEVNLTVEDNSGDQASVSIIVEITYKTCDINGDGWVDQQDKLEMNRVLNGMYTLYPIELFDFNYDGNVDQQDNLIMNRILNGVPLY